MRVCVVWTQHFFTSEGVLPKFEGQHGVHVRGSLLSSVVFFVIAGAVVPRELPLENFVD